MSSIGNELRFLTLAEPKHGHLRNEYEDACAANVELGRFAISDGATESAYAALWARMLVDTFVSAPLADPTCWAEWLPELQARWEIEVGQRPLPWYAEIKWQQGSFATFLGLVVQPRRWQALAVGDCCLFHVRDRQLQIAFPALRAVDFVCSPWLIGSRGFTPEIMAMRELRLGGDLRPGDRLWMMTDALAKWFVQATEQGQRPWESLEPLLTNPDAAASFGSWIAALRASHQIRNDDVTLLAVWLP
jgi:hypothetical protein